MVDRYDEQRRQLKDRKPWVANEKKSGNPPSVMTVTHVNQTKDLYVCYAMLSASNIFLYCEYVLRWFAFLLSHECTNLSLMHVRVEFVENIAALWLD